MQQLKNLLNNNEVKGFEIRKNNESYFTLIKESEEMADVYIYDSFVDIESISNGQSENITTIKELNDFLKNNCLTFNELQEAIKEANTNSGLAWDHIVKYPKYEFMNEILSYSDIESLLTMAFYGGYNPNHEYVGYDGNGNIESMDKITYHMELLRFQDEIIQDLQD
mgnify:CR=1 FL=1